MDASSRITLIEKIADTLAIKSVERINLILTHNGYGGITPFGGDKASAVIQELKFGQDENLLKLAKHLKLTILKDELFSEPDFWEEGYFKLFISHLVKDKLIATQLKENLEPYAITCFVAHENIKPTREWQTEIEKALRSCDSLTALITKDFGLSKWTDQEIGFVYARNVFIIPVKMGADPYGFISKFQALSFIDNIQLAHSIFSLLLNNPNTTLKLSNALMHKFENSDSFAGAKSAWRKLELLPVWNDELEKRFYKAYENNSQIRGSYRVPSNIDYYIEQSKKKHRKASV